MDEMRNQDIETERNMNLELSQILLKSLAANGHRALHANSSERLLLLSVLAQNMMALENKDTDARTLQQRTQVWTNVTKAFNDKSQTPRSRSQVCSLYLK